MASGSSDGSAKPGVPAKLPNICAEGEPDRAIIYEAVGYALSHWETLQEQIAEMFYLLVDAEIKKGMSLAAFAARRAYGTLTAPQSQRLAIMAAVEARLPGETTLQNRINALLEEFRIEANKRNNIAHGVLYFRIPDEAPIIFEGYGTPGKRPVTDIVKQALAHLQFEDREWPIMWFLAPPLYNAARNKLPIQHPGGAEEEQDYRYNAVKIRQIAAGWERLIDTALKINDDIPAAKNQPRG